MLPFTAVAPARAGLLGNPSDVYGGKTLAFAYQNQFASVHIAAAEQFTLADGAPGQLDFARPETLTHALHSPNTSTGERLLRAALIRFGARFPQLRELPSGDPRLHFSLQFQSTIPMQVGLAGSSAIIVAALRALCHWFSVELPPHAIAETALAAETEELHITAGPMDRVIQAFGGVLLMDFAQPQSSHSYQRIEARSLPPLVIAWDPNGSEPSGAVHQEVRKRWLANDPAVRTAIARFPALVDAGMKALSKGDPQAFRNAVDENFDTRAGIWRVRARDHEMIAIARQRGAAAKFAGSGGAIVAVLRSEEDAPSLESAYQTAGYRTLRPVLAPERGRLA